MAKWGFLLAIAASAGCGTRPNPAVSCSDGSCSDPNFPFCDTDGAIDGEPGECISVTCTPGEFAACRGDDAELRCDATGANFDLIHCPKGCDDSSDGCRVCDPGETVCSSGKVQTCADDGTVVATEDCALGCFKDEARCIDVNPSNGLAMYLDMVTDPPDLHVPLSTSGMTSTVNTATGELLIDGQSVTVPTFLAPAPNDGIAIRVFVIHDLVIDDELILSAGNVEGPAVAFLATGDVRVNGRIVVQSGALSTCAGGDGHDFSSFPDREAGGGGGGNATVGARGGANGAAAPGSGGPTHGTQELVPLVGGCDSGGVVGTAQDTGDPTPQSGVFGGGALQLVSRHSITVNAKIDAHGGDGYADEFQNSTTSVMLFATGGGGGGAVLLEAPIVTLTDSAEIDASGGNGATFPATGKEVASPGGAGARVGVPAGQGGDQTIPANDTTHEFITGGGGGGLGRVRVNTPSDGFQPANAQVSADETLGVLRTR